MTAHFFKVYLFILWETETVWAREGQRTRERESQAGSTLSAYSQMWGLNSQTVRSCPELKPRVGCLTNWATQAPPTAHFLFENYFNNMECCGSNHLFLMRKQMLKWKFDIKNTYCQFAKELHQILWRKNNRSIERHQITVPQEQVQVSSHALLGKGKS